MLFPGIQQTVIHTFVLFHILLHDSLLQDTGYSTCAIQEDLLFSCLFFIQFVSADSKLLIIPPPSPFLFGKCKFVFCVCESGETLNLNICQSTYQLPLPAWWILHSSHQNSKECFSLAEPKQNPAGKSTRAYSFLKYTG